MAAAETPFPLETSCAYYLKSVISTLETLFCTSETKLFVKVVFRGGLFEPSKMAYGILQWRKAICRGQKIDSREQKIFLARPRRLCGGYTQSGWRANSLVLLYLARENLTPACFQAILGTKGNVAKLGRGRLLLVRVLSLGRIRLSVFDSEVWRVLCFELAS